MFSRTFSQLRHKRYMFPRNVPFGLMLQTCCMLYLSKAVTPLRLDDVQVDQCIWEKKVITVKIMETLGKEQDCGEVSKDRLSWSLILKNGTAF